MKTIFIAVLVILAALASSHGQPLNIVVLGSQYTTSVAVYPATENPPWPPPISRTTSYSSPVSDEIDAPFYYQGFIFNCSAIASAGLFTDQASSGWGIANASATTQIWFSPSEDQTQTVHVTYSTI